MTDADRDKAFRERCQMEGNLSQMLCEYLWDKYRPFTLGDSEFEIVGSDEVPGYEDDDQAVLMRRTSDGKVFEVYIEPTIGPARTPSAEPEEEGS